MDQFSTLALLDHALEGESNELPDVHVCFELSDRINRSKIEYPHQMSKDR